MITHLSARDSTGNSIYFRHRKTI